MVQPLLDLLGDAPEFFVARQNTTGDILVLTLVVTLVPPLVATAFEALVLAASPTAGRLLHLVLVAVLVAAVALQVLAGAAGGSSTVLLPLALVAGAAGAVAYARTRFAPLVLSVLAPAPLVFVLVFLLVSPVSKLVLGSDEAVAADVAVPGDTPVVMIVFDELSGVALMGPDGGIDASRLPGFAALARDATWYRNATTVSDFTDRAVPALLTGERPERGSVPTASDNPESLFTLLGRSYDFAVTEPVTDLCPQRLCPSETTERIPAGRRLRDLWSDLSLVSLHLLLPDDLSRDLAPIDRSFGDFRAAAGAGQERTERTSADDERATAAFLALIARDQQLDAFVRGLGRRSRRPSLSFLHTQLPHNPYVYLPDGRRYADISPSLPTLEDRPDTPGGAWSRSGGALARQAQERYLLQVGYADRQLGRVLERLRATGTYDRALIVVMADHGASFEPGTPHRALTSANVADVASIPLLVKGPGQRAGRVDDANVSSVDVLPTIASLLRIRLPWDVDGAIASRGSPPSVVLQPRAGEGELSLPFADFVRRRDASLARMAAAFRLGMRAPRLRPGADADLVGRPVAGAARAAAVEAGRFELDDPKAFADVDPGGPRAPLLVAGRVTGARSAERFAVAIEGRVAALAPTYEDDGVRRFVAFVPRAAFARGENRVEVVGIAGAGAARRLTLLRSDDVDFRLRRDGAREVLVDPQGRELRVGPGVEGYVDSAVVDGGRVELAGWAGDTDARRTAERVVAFADGRFVGSGKPDRPRPDLVEKFGRPLDRAGFRIGGRLPAGADVARGSLRAFAVLGDTASPIEGAQVRARPGG